jgi:hypothetical protein
MKHLLWAGAALAASVAAIDYTQPGCGEEEGNFYCKPVQKISYSGIGKKGGKYDKVTNMEGGCQKEPVDFSGPLSPLDKDVSVLCVAL